MKKSENEKTEILNIDDIIPKKASKKIKEVKTSPKKDYLKTILLIISILFLLSSIGIFIYLKRLNQDEQKKKESLNQNIQDIKENIVSSNNTKTEKESEYEKLQKDYSEQLEELEVWKELKEKLESSLQ